MTRLDRRRWLVSAGLSLLFAAPRAARSAPTTTAPSRKVVVVVFQRGACDGLSAVPPYADPRYYELRPTIAIAPPGKPDGAVRLDATFGLHPSLAPLEDAWKKKTLAVVHAVGSPDPTRSHFDAQDYVESGTPGVKSTEGGWLNRALALRPPAGPTKDLRAVAFAPTLPRILSGSASVLALNSLRDLRVNAGGGGARTFEQMYAKAVDVALRGTADEAFDAMATLKNLPPDASGAQNGAAYPNSPLAKRLAQIATLVRANVGLEVAMTDTGGWDTHFNQGAAQGQLAGRLGDLGASLAAFATDLGDALRDVCLVTVTEFGRTARENGTKGTDHGHGSVMFVLGGGVHGGKVYGTFKGLADDQLHESRDLPVTTDHRQVFGAVLQKQTGNRNLAAVYPGFDFAKNKPLPLFG